MVSRDYEAHIPPLTTPIPNLYLGNMFQVYPQDRGQNYSIKLADRLVALIDLAPGAPSTPQPTAGVGAPAAG